MIMTDGEIITSYNQAKNKKSQVTVLADLNAVSVMEMELHLETLGLLTRSSPKPPAPLKSKPVMDELRAMELFKEGKSDLEISEMLGEPITKVKDWRRRNGFLRPRGGSRPGIPRKKKAEVQPAAPAPEPLPDAARASGSITVTCLLDILSDFAGKYPDAKVYLDGQRMLGVRMSVLYEPGGPAEAEIYLLEAEAAGDKKRRKQ